jgi:hypothetical protein
MYTVLGELGLRGGDLYDDAGMRHVYRPNTDYVYPNGDRHRRRSHPDGTKTVKWPKGKNGGGALYFANKIPPGRQRCT